MKAFEKSHESCSPEVAEVLCRMAGLGAVTAEALAAHRNCSIASARGRLLTLQRHGLVARWRPLVGEPSLYTVTQRGVRMAGIEGISPARVSAAGARHALWCSRAVTALECAYPYHRVLGEPAFRRLEREYGRPLYSVPISGAGAGALHRPDLVLEIDHQDQPRPIVVEVELTVKAPRRLVAICRAWARCRQLAGVLYLTSEEVQTPLARAIETAQAGGLIVQVRMDALERI
jgi:hypothetical protein